MNKLIVILLFVALLFGASTFSIHNSKQIHPSTSVTVSVSPKIFEWSITISNDHYQNASYFQIQKPGYYVLIADGTAPKGQITIQIESSSGRMLKEIKASHLKKQNKIYLQPGKYRLTVITKNAKHSNYHIYINSTD
ncbi:MAG: hypothetical protein WCS44_04770 [Bacillota bacterium]|nr:hypothetical protein [Bacillota bacterium]